MTFVDRAHRYQLTRRIATGGMGEVWRASDTVLGREVAVAKVLRDGAQRCELGSTSGRSASAHTSTYERSERTIGPVGLIL